jgi:hypothetical protein
MSRLSYLFPVLYIFIFGQPIYDYRLVLSSLISPLQFFGLIPQFPKVSPVYVNYVTTASSSSQCTPIHSGNHPPYTPDSEKIIQLRSPLQRLLDRYIAAHRHESQQSLLDENFHVQFGLKRLRRVKTLSLQFTG